MRSDEAHLTLVLQGNLRVLDPEGRPLPVSGKGALTLLACLGVSRDMRRSRDWLKALIWSRTEKPQNDYSLRSALAALKSMLGDHAEHLCADKSYVWLKDVRLAEIDPEETSEFFEDAPPNIGEPFDDWLRMERSAFEAKVRKQREAADTSGGTSGGAAGVPATGDRAIVVSGPEAQRAARPCLGILPTVIMPQNDSARSIGKLTVHQMIDCLRIHDIADCCDYHDLTSDQFAALGGRMPEIHSYVKLAVLLRADEVHLAVTCRDAKSHRVEVTHSITLGWDGAATPWEEIYNFAATSVDAIQTRLVDKFRNSAGSEDPESSLPAAVHQIMALSPDRQEMARAHLLRSGLVQRSGAAAGWYCFSYANTVGEGDPDLRADRLEELERHCTAALDLDPTNALSMALVAHVRGFVLRQLDEGARLARAARERAPYLAIAWDLSAMNALYRGEVGEAYRFAERARQLGRFSPYKPIIESSFAISASVNGRHEQALHAGREILRRRPGYLAVMRHMSGSLAATGRTDAARSMIAEVQKHDRLFQADTIRKPDYPLPSAASVALIRRGFELTGLLKN